jgi:NAD-dependent SIR2 family protein deacetylase
MAATPPTQRFLRYAPQRDIVFVLGAGASHPDGVPLQQDILPMIISDGNCGIAGSSIGQQIRKFVTDNFHVDECACAYPELEAVFGFLDYFIQQNESLNSTYDPAAIRQIKENLIKAIHYIVNLRTDERSQIYHLFWDSISRNNRNVSIITLNYDTLLEQAFDFMFRKLGYLDYCIHLMNYERLDPLAGFNFWVNPRLPVPVGPGEDPVPFKVIKLHGSLNWKYCNCCNQVLLTPWDRKIDLDRGKLIGHTYPEAEEYDYHCPLDGTEFQTLILPPSYLKALNHPIITQLFGEAATEIRASRKVVFIGYSLSDADVHIKALFMRNLRRDAQLVVINTKKASRLKQQYCALSKSVQYLQCSFEDLVHDARLMHRILAETADAPPQ